MLSTNYVSWVTQNWQLCKNWSHPIWLLRISTHAHPIFVLINLQLQLSANKYNFNFKAAPLFLQFSNCWNVSTRHWNRRIPMCICPITCTCITQGRRIGATESAAVFRDAFLPDETKEDRGANDLPNAGLPSTWQSDGRDRTRSDVMTWRKVRNAGRQVCETATMPRTGRAT